jgi:hypothetical protein
LSIAIEDVVLYMGIESFLVRCTGKDGFIIPNVTILYQQQSEWMQEFDVC